MQDSIREQVVLSWCLRMPRQHERLLFALESCLGLGRCFLVRVDCILCTCCLLAIFMTLRHAALWLLCPSVPCVQPKALATATVIRAAVPQPFVTPFAVCLVPTRPGFGSLGPTVGTIVRRRGHASALPAGTRYIRVCHGPCPLQVVLAGPVLSGGWACLAPVGLDSRVGAQQNRLRQSMQVGYPCPDIGWSLRQQ